MAKEKFRRLALIAALAAVTIMGASPTLAQNSNGKVTTAAPAYTNNTWAPLSLTPTGELRVTGGGSGGTIDTNLVELAGDPLQVTTPGVLDVNVVNGGGGGAVDITEIGGTPVGTTVPGALDITCVSGCVAGSGVSQGTATTAAPTYVDGTNNPLSLDLAGNLRTAIAGSLPTGANTIGAVSQAGAPWTVDATQSGSWTVGVSSLPSLPAGTNNIGDVDVLSLPALPAGNNNIGDVDVATLPALPAGTNLLGFINPVPSGSAVGVGMSNFSAIMAASTNATSVKAGAGNLYEISVYNNSANIAYLKLYNTASAPTCGSGTPVGVYLIPGASAGGAGSNVTLAMGKSFTTGIGFCVTSGIANADTGAVAASTYIVNLSYK